MYACNEEEAIRSTFPEVKEDYDSLESISIYTGMNRAIFRDGVALTSNAKMLQNMGQNPYNDEDPKNSILNIIAYSSLAVGAVTFVSGLAMTIHSSRATEALKVAYDADIAKYKAAVTEAKKGLVGFENKLKPLEDAHKEMEPKALDILRRSKAADGHVDYSIWTDEEEDLMFEWGENESQQAKIQMEMKETSSYKTIKNEKLMQEAKKQKDSLRPSSAGRWVMGIGGALMLTCAGIKLYQYLDSFYHYKFKRIPNYIVDEADIVTFVTDKDGNTVYDESGNPKRNIDFDQFLYYQGVKCNRQEVGKDICDWQEGVDKYAEWGCGDIADLGCDQGRQWLALYTVKSSAKGDPILADSLVFSGSDETPAPVHLPEPDQYG